MNARVAGWLSTDSAAALGTRTPDDLPRFLTVHDLADYLHVNEKKVYALASEGLIPATKITGKWLFPRELVDQWMLESTHGGVLTDRMTISGSGDPLLQAIVDTVATVLGNRALLSYCPTATRQGLELLARGRVDVCALHWGPAEESRHRHPALLQRFGPHRPWVLMRLFQREQGVMLAPAIARRYEQTHELFDARLRWVLRPDGSGSQRFFLETLAQQERSVDTLNVCTTACTGRDAASALALGLADAAPGSRGLAAEHGLGFCDTGWEAFDLVMAKDIFFRSMMQSVLQQLRSDVCRQKAMNLGGYDFQDAGTLIWSS